MMSINIPADPLTNARITPVPIMCRTRTRIAASDPLFRLYLMILVTTPAAINLSTISTLHGFGSGPIAQLLFAQYVAGALPMAIWFGYYIHLCGFG